MKGVIIQAIINLICMVSVIAFVVLMIFIWVYDSKIALYIGVSFSVFCVLAHDVALRFCMKILRAKRENKGGVE